MWFNPVGGNGAAYTSKFMAYREAVQEITNGVKTQVQFNVESYDDESEYSHDGTFLFVAKETGKYRVGCTVGLSSLGDGASITLDVLKNDTDIVLTGIDKAGDVGAMTQHADGDIKLSANDELQVDITHNDAAARNTRVVSGCMFHVHRIG